MNFDQIIEEIPDFEIKKINQINVCENSSFLNNEALFQLPLICLIILNLAKARRKPQVSEIGQLVGECIEASFEGFKGSAQHIGWSANLRIRTIKALNFLEAKKFIDVDHKTQRIVTTSLGQKVVKRALEFEDELSYNLSNISIAYRNICLRKKMDTELWDEIN
ncbi:Uncharacterised protein [Acinetobacter baumannii]|uniref:hypothetical protein n=1 Tax=Acinetobacter TaxID=469 RepID=UPI000361775B|nr:hypothetical protein [Acinetobacter baumannii]MCZ3016765.1 hypothetical protein [Acinetobacter baumannii]RSR01325.1 hypothetical protein EA687_08090 [Acinetobacter baumannii]SSU65143.1 Uncharacterised protein [Acinetobacter baumannii]